MSNSELEIVNCPACDSSDYSVWMLDGKDTRYVKCKSCGTIYASPRASWSSRYNWLDQEFAYGDNAIENALIRQEGLSYEAEIIKRYSNSGKLLDIGCDLGDFFSCFNQSEWKFFGIEVSPSAAEYIRQHYPAEIFTGLLNQTSLKDNNFDVVTMLDTLFYVDYPKADFKEIFRILKPGGYFAVEMPGLNYQMLRSRGLLCWLIDRQWTRLCTDSSYICWFSPKGLKKLFTTTGFVVDQTISIPSPSVSRSNRSNIYKLASKIYYNQFKSSSKHVNANSWAPRYLMIGRKP